MATPKKDDPVYRRIIAARVTMMFDMQFFGAMASQLSEDDASEWLETMAVDGRCLFYNRDFILGLTQKQLYFVMGHEVLHCVYDHICRRGNRDPDLWNMAIDYIVNYTLKKWKVGEMPPYGLYDENYTDEMSSEELYAILKKKNVKRLKPLDTHLDAPKKGAAGTDGKTRNGNITVDADGRECAPSLTEEELEQRRNDMLAATIRTAQSLPPGKVPQNIWLLIDQLITPKMDWRSMLDVHIRSAIKDDYTYARISPKSFATGAILPSPALLDTIDICVAIDTSGSMTDDMLRDILSEIKGIMQTFREFRLRVWTFDAKVHPESFMEFNGENIDDIDHYKLYGRGGTVLEVNWTFMRKNDIEPTRLVVFTDGEVSSWGDPNYCDTLFVIHSNPHIKAPWGITAHYDNDNAQPMKKAA